MKNLYPHPPVTRFFTFNRDLLFLHFLFSWHLASRSGLETALAELHGRTGHKEVPV